MDDKFIMMGLNDDTRNIAEVLKNPTCKKILDFLGDVKEASEKDIAGGLGMAINTVEYNLNKLIKAGLVEKTKNFFWSVKGKKIPMYKLARKHIIISPGKKPSLTVLKTVLPIFIIAIALVALIISFFPGEQPVVDQAKLKQFSSQAELESFVKEYVEVGGYRREMMETVGVAKAMGVGAVTGATEAGGAAEDFSQTNIQVEGVDEPDIVKNDGKYIYYVVSGKKVVIVEAYPAENMKILNEIDLNVSVNEIFINDDKLIIFATGSEYLEEDCDVKSAGVSEDEIEIMPRYCGYYKSRNVVYIYDVSDRENPELKQEIGNDGSYLDSRMIKDYVYVISTKYVVVDRPEPPVYIANSVEKKVSAEEVYYFDYPDTNYVFTLVTTINVNSGEFNSEVYLTGSTSNVYISQDNIYLTYQKSMRYDKYIWDMVEEVLLPLLPSSYEAEIMNIMNSDKDIYEKYSEVGEIVEEYSKSLTGTTKSDFDKEFMRRAEEFQIKIQKETEKTVIHKINIKKDKINYEGAGEVPGRILNQFSMDEYKGYFRIATTTGSWRQTSLNHLYVLNKDLKIVGKVEDLAKGERIYSTRFMGERAYVVTFKKIDPLFVIDLSEPEKPEVLGYLKITGYSDYLHIYDENHVIGLGKETIAAEQGDFAWYQGIKISLFDVSDVKNPIEKAKIEIGDRGTDSYALYEHKAFLFSKEKNLLVIPINLAEIDKNRYEGEVPDNAYGEHVWQGAYVFDISLNGIELRGEISHQENFTKNEWGYVNIDYNKQIQRSLYMDDILYTLSQARIKANNLQTIEEIDLVELPYEEYYYPYYEAI